MTSYRVMTAVLEGEDAISKARRLCGPTDPCKAPKGTIRGDFSNDSMEEKAKINGAVENIVHASASQEEAKKEIESVREFLKNI